MDHVAAVDLPFVGRAEQIELFRTALGRARAGEPGAAKVDASAIDGAVKALQELK